MFFVSVGFVHYFRTFCVKAISEMLSMLLHTHHLPLFQYIHLLKSQEIKKNLCLGWREFFETVCATFYKSIVFFWGDWWNKTELPFSKERLVKICLAYWNFLQKENKLWMFLNSGNFEENNLTLSCLTIFALSSKTQSNLIWFSKWFFPFM